MKKKYSLLNLFRGTRIDFEAKDQVEAAAMGVTLLFNKEKGFDAKEITMKNKEKAVHLTGKDRESGEELIIILVETRVVMKTEELRDFTKVN